LNNIFGKYYPIVIDCETSGLDPDRHAILEVAYACLDLEHGRLRVGSSETFHVEPFENAQFDPKSMEIHQIDHSHPLRFAEPEAIILKNLATFILEKAKKAGYRRAILVGHNAWFDLAFINKAYQRHNLKSPFHQFTTCDTATLSGFFLKETVLAKALYKAHISYNPKEAHGALYDVEQTAKLVCYLWNKLNQLQKQANENSLNRS
jgi:ribonuclease T